MTRPTSTYERQENEAYYTPDWAVGVGLSMFQRNMGVGDIILEPACGDGRMAYVIKNSYPGNMVIATDIAPPPALGAWLPGIFHVIMEPVDFLQAEPLHDTGGRVHIITNPPFGKGGHTGAKFIRKALELTEPSRGTVTMLLPMAFDCGSTRTDIFRDHPAFDAKVVLLDRIRWRNLEQKKSGPTADHAWFYWDWGRCDVAAPEQNFAPAILYAGNPTKKVRKRGKNSEAEG